MALIALGLIPVYAFRNLGAGSNFAVLANAVTVSGTAGTATNVSPGPAGGGAGVVGANTPPSVGITAALNAPGGVTSSGVPAALAAAQAAANTFFSQAQTVNNDPSAAGELGGVNLSPGLYYINGNASLTTGDLTVTGPGDYVIAINGSFSTAVGMDIITLPGTSPANVFLIVNGLVSLNGSRLDAEVVAYGGITTTDGAVVNGKLVAVAGSGITFNDDNTVTDYGIAPTFSSPTQLTYDVCIDNDVVNYTVTAADPDGTGTTTLSSTIIPVGSTQTPALPTATGSSAFSWDPGPGDVGAHVITYTATDQTGAINTLTVTINVTQPPVLSVALAPTGAISGNGTSGTPFVICPMDTLTYGVTSSDPDGDLVVVSVTATPNLTHAPTALPNAPALNVNTTATFQPDLSQEGTLVQIDYTSTDNSAPACTTTASVYVQVTNQPHFSAPGNLAAVQNACVGDLLQFDVTAGDDDGAETLQLSALGTPTGAIHAPNFTGVDVSGPGGGDILNFGNEVTSRFEWTPLPQDVGTHVVTYTVVDDLGCTEDLVVTINVTTRPTIAVNSGGPVAEGDILTACPGQAPLVFTVTGTDPDGDDLTLDATGVPANLTHLPVLPANSVGPAPVSTTATFAPTMAQAGQTFTVTYTVTDEFDCDVDQVVTIFVSNPPVFTSPTTINACVGDSLRIPVSASDADAGDVVTLTNTLLPAGATLVPALPVNGNPAATEIVWTPGTAGSFTANFTATDSANCTGTLSVTINVSNLPTVSATVPTGGQGGTGSVADPYRVCVGQTANFTVNASSGDVGENVTVTQSGAPAGLTPSGNPLSSGTPNAAVAQSFTPASGLGGQVITVTYTATDASGAACTATSTITFEVSNPPVFVEPTATTLNVCAGSPVTYTVRASDADPGDVITLTSTAAPAGATLTPALPANGNPVSTVFNWTPAAAGSFPVTYTATDASGFAVTQLVTVNVSSLPTVSTTTISGGLGGGCTVASPYRICVGQTATYTVNANSGDIGEAVTITQTGAPAGLTPSSNPLANGTPSASVGQSFTPTSGQGGQTFTVTYTATDGSGGACTATTTVTFQVSNPPDVTVSQSVVDICVGQSVQFQVRATDADPGIVNLAQSGAPASLTFAPTLPLGGNPVATVATFTPTAVDAGSTVVTFTATDAEGCTDTATVTLNVSQAPTIAVLGASGAMHGSGTAADPYVLCPPGTGGASTLTYGVNASDPDAGDTVTLSQSGSPGTANYVPGLPTASPVPGAPASSNFSYTATVADAGQTFTITYTATDDSSAECTATETVVIRVDNLPVITASQNTVNICVGQTATFRVRGTDADGGIVTLSQTGAPASLVLSPGLPLGGNPVETVATFTPVAGDAGTNNVTFTATDTDGCSQTTVVTLNVSQVPTVAVSGVTGAPGSGTAADPYVVCPPGTAAASTISYLVTAADADAGDVVTVTETGTPSGATYTPALTPGNPVNSVFSFTPTAGQAGQTFTVTYTATDNSAAGCSSSTTVVIRVANLPQFVGGTPADGTVFNVCTGQRVTFRVRASDADAGDQVTLSESGGLAGFFTPGLPAVGNPVETVFDWTPGAGAPSTSTLVFTATDKSGCAQTRTITINVSKIPTVAVSAVSGAPGSGTAADPYVVCPPGTAAASTITYTVTGADADAGDLVTLSQSGAPAGATHVQGLPAQGNPVTTNFTFTPAAGDAGQVYTITYTVLDNSGAACSSTATVVIRVSNLPQFTAPTQTTYNVCAGSPLSFTVRATDADDDDTVTLTSSTLPAGATLTPSLLSNGNPVEAQFNWTPSTNGTFTVTFTATDDSGCSQTRTVTINVSAVPTVAISNVTGSMHGVGTEADPLVVCATPAAPLTFQVTGSDADAGQTVNITTSGMPSGATFNTTGTNPTVGTFSFSPTTQQGGGRYAVTFTGADNSAAGCNSSVTVYIRVSSLPVVTATPNNLVLCEGQDINFRVRATDSDVQHVTLTGPSISATAGAPALVLTHTPSLPMSGNSVETVVVGKSPLVTANATYVLTYTATDEDGCVSTTTVTIQVMETPPTTVVLTRNADGDPFGEEICYTATVFDNCAEAEGGPRRVPGVPVLFQVTGETGNNQTTTIITDANGEAKLCITPLFPGTLSVTAGIDLNQDGVVDSGTTPDSDSVTVPAPVQDGAGCFINGRGSVSVENPLFGDVPLTGQFTLNVSPKRGKLAGGMTFTVVGGGVTAKGKRTNVTVRAVELESMTCGEDATGRHAVLFGQASVKGMSDRGINGTVPFRVDLLDAGTAGTPGDRFVLTFLNQTTNLPVGPLGGNLDSGRGNRKPAGDISIRMGIRK